MHKLPLTLDHLSEEQRRELKRLTARPAISWPTVLQWFVVVGITLANYSLAVLGLYPLWVGTVINTVMGYMGFSILHDAIHRSISSNVRLNDWLGQSAAFLGSPYVNLKLFRWGHSLHHRFTNSDKDPDIIFNGPAWSLPLRWMLIDLVYFRHAIKHGDKVSRPEFRKTLYMVALTALLFALVIYWGYGWHLFWLWFVPSRLIFLLLGYSFFWLPHVPHDTVQADNFTRATAIRVGWEWLMSPLFQWQNYHLIHHMYPSTPFYNNRRVWKLLEPELRNYDLAVQHDFAIHPTIYPAGTWQGEEPPAAVAN